MTRKRATHSLIRLDPKRLEGALLQLAMSKTEFADELEASVSANSLSRNTVIKAFDGKPIRPRTARDLAEALKVGSVHDLMVNKDSASDDGPETAGEWEITSQTGGWITESNGLQYRLCRMKHCFIAGRLGRGKQYDLQNSVTREQERIEDYLIRHATVSEMLRGSEYFPETLSTFPAADQKSWWIVDRLVEGQSLSDLLQNGPLDRAILPNVMRNVLEGLSALHQSGIVFRELAPRRVLLIDGGERILLTDFELAKLLDSRHSVSSSWPENSWRAPEVVNGHVDARADLYSWARLLLQAATGTLPPQGRDLDAIMMAGLPKAVWRVATDCLSPFADDRPRSVAQVRKRIRRWRQEPNHA